MNESVSLNQSTFDNPFGHPMNRSFSIFISTYFILLMICGIVFNGVLIHTIVRCTWLYSTTNTLIVNLAIGNLLVAVFVLPFEFHYIILGYYKLGTFVCGLKETMFMFSLPSSIVNLFILTFERFMKILLPYKYEEFFSRRRVAIMIIITWSYTLLVALLPFILNPNAAIVEEGTCYTTFPTWYSVYQVVCNFIVPLVCIVGMNLKIFWIAQHHHRIIQHQTIHLNIGDKNGHKSKHFTANFKAAKTIMMLVGIFLFCWLTYIVLVILNILCELCLPRELTWTSNAVNYSSIALNPLLYGLRNSDVRRVLLRKYARLYCCNKNDELLKRDSNGQLRGANVSMPFVGSPCEKDQSTDDIISDARVY